MKRIWKTALPPKGNGFVWPMAASALAFCALFAANTPAQENNENLGRTRETLEKWVETERVISSEKSDLTLACEMLDERIELVKREIDALKEKIKDSEKSIGELDKKRGDLAEENETYTSAVGSLEEALQALETRTKELLPRLPDPIRERVKPLSQRLPEDPKESKLSLSQRFQNAIGILNEVNKFNQEIAVVSEVRELPDATSVEVSTFYLGLGQAYYVGPNAQIAGIGTATDSAWVWKPADAFARQIADIIAILQNEKIASFVQVPVEID